MPFERVVRSLLDGRFVCKISDSSGFDYLESVEPQASVNDYLSRIGKRLARTVSGNAFYVSNFRMDADDRKVIKENFSNIANMYRLAVGFLNMTMQIISEDSIAFGARIEANRMLVAIGDRPDYRTDLANLSLHVKGAALDGTDRARLGNIFKKFVSEGYLVVVDAEREIYQVTGKIEWLIEAIDFMTEYSGINLDKQDADAAAVVEAAFAVSTAAEASA